MTDKSLLAAVRSAVTPPASAVDASTSQTQENQMADSKTGPADVPAKITSLADLRAHYGDICSEIDRVARAEGAKAERERIDGIDKLGKDMPGHDALIADLKADGKTTPEQAAMALIAADGEIRRNQLAGVKSVEDKTGKVAATPHSGGPETTKSSATTPEGWAAEYAAQDAKGEKLRSEFATKDDYVAFKANESKVRILGARKSA